MKKIILLIFLFAITYISFPQAILRFTDYRGKTIQNVKIYTENRKIAETSNGIVKFYLRSYKQITVVAKNYKPLKISTSELSENDTINIILQKDSKKTVLPFSVKKRVFYRAKNTEENFNLINYEIGFQTNTLYGYGFQYFYNNGLIKPTKGLRFNVFYLFFFPIYFNYSVFYTYSKTDIYINQVHYQNFFFKGYGFDVGLITHLSKKIYLLNGINWTSYYARLTFNDLNTYSKEDFDQRVRLVNYRISLLLNLSESNISYLRLEYMQTMFLKYKLPYGFNGLALTYGFFFY